jgi:hypothetical protein
MFFEQVFFFKSLVLLVNRIFFYTQIANKECSNFNTYRKQSAFLHTNYFFIKKVQIKMNSHKKCNIFKFKNISLSFYLLNLIFIAFKAISKLSSSNPENELRTSAG